MNDKKKEIKIKKEEFKKFVGKDVEEVVEVTVGDKKFKAKIKDKIDGLKMFTPTKAKVEVIEYDKKTTGDEIGVREITTGVPGLT